MEVTEGDDDDTVVAVAAIMLPKFRHTLPAAPRSVAAPRSLASPSMAAARYQPVLVPWLLLVPRLIGKSLPSHTLIRPPLPTGEEGIVKVGKPIWA